MKKLVALLLAIVMVAGLLAACNTEKPVETKPQETQGNQPADTKPAETEPPVVELEEKTIQIWLAGTAKQKDSDKVWEAFNEMLQQYVPNTTVEFTIFPMAEYGDNFNRMLASGEAVDLAWVGYKTNLTTDQTDGNLMPLDDLLNEYGQGIIEAIGTEVMDMNRFRDGELYYMISWQGLLSNKYGFWVPTELAELAGEGWVEATQAAIDKWWHNEPSGENFAAVFDQFAIYLEACKNAGRLYSGLAPNYTWTAWNAQKGLVKSISGVNNIGIARSSDNKWVAIDGVTCEEKRVMAQKYAEFYEKGYFRSDIASVDQSTLKFVEDGVYNANTVVFYTHTLYNENMEITKEKAAGVDLTFFYREKYAELGKGESTAMAVPYCADDPERAIMVLNALYTVPELYQLLIYGIEGEHYVDNGDGTITTPYGAEGTDDSDYGVKRWIIGTCLNSLVTQNDVPGYYEGLLEAQQTAKANPFATFKFDKTNVSDICTALTAIDKKYSNLVDLAGAGADCEKELDNWIAERKAAGVDKVLEEYQRQIDAFIEANNITSW